LPSKSTKSWKVVRAEKSVNERRVASYKRLMDAEELIAHARYRRGESEAAIEEALALSDLNDSEVGEEPDLYLTVLSRYVAALGGHLEVLAVFPQETIAVRRVPDHPTEPDPA
jgi:hypothetical protein